jgi:hypothetical protein
MWTIYSWGVKGHTIADTVIADLKLGCGDVVHHVDNLQLGAKAHEAVPDTVIADLAMKALKAAGAVAHSLSLRSRPSSRSVSLFLPTPCGEKAQQGAGGTPGPAAC